MADTKPVAFLSFVSSDFQHEEGRIAQFRERLTDEVSMHTGKEMSIFQDRDDALWKQAWEEHVEQAQSGEDSGAPAFLIAFITPRFFRSDQCRSEMQEFLELERRLNRIAGQVAIDAVFPCARDHLHFQELWEEEGLEPHKTATVLFWGAEEPDTHFDIGKSIDTKIAAVMAHQSQMRSRTQAEIVEFVKDWAINAGADQEFQYAEAFRKLTFRV